MNKNKVSQEEFEQIERYLNNDMSKEELLAFEELLSNDKQLSKKVESFRVMIQAVEEDALKKKMENIHLENFSENTKDVSDINATDTNKKIISINRNKSIFQKYAVAASIALLIAVGTYFFTNQKSGNEKIYASHFTPDPGLVTPMSATDDYEFYRGMVDYKQAKYDLAITRWTKLLDAQPENDSLHYFIGVSKMAKGKTLDAIEHFSLIEDHPENIFYKDALFYLGLCELLNNNNEKARQNFEKSNTQKSQAILKDLKN